jgi:mannose-1-phosphate guanylyltransferase/mannose-6-phosphate isomerase
MPDTARSSRRIVPILLSGGAGVRLWPMSREAYPKQLLCLVSDRSMLQETARRVSDGTRFTAPLVICNEEHRFAVAEQLHQLATPPRAIILEPCARNTAAAVAVAALVVAQEEPEGQMLVLPADHVVEDLQAFHAAVDVASRAASSGRLVTFGIVPSHPEPGYGYIRCGQALEGCEGAFEVRAFVEKPPRSVAEALIAGGDCFWNSGMFLFPVRTVLEEMGRHMPDILEACGQALSVAVRDLDFLRVDREAFERVPSISIDHALMEKTDRVAVVPAKMGWTDVGGWPALWDVGKKDEDGNVCIGDVMALGCNASYVRSESVLTAVIGLDGFVVVATEDAVLVAPKDRMDEIKAVVERLKTAGRSESRVHRKVHRPWGFYQGLHAGERFQVKRLTVEPGKRLSLQKHFHRAEHWIVVNGTALVTRGDEQVLVRENESIYIPLGMAHRLENPGKVPLNLIEVQSGAYLGEDDIVRLDDAYGRD